MDSSSWLKDYISTLHLITKGHHLVLAEVQLILLILYLVELCNLSPLRHS